MNWQPAGANDEPNDEDDRSAAERESLAAHLLNGPDLDELDLQRDPSPMRKIQWSESGDGNPQAKTEQRIEERRSGYDPA